MENSKKDIKDAAIGFLRLSSSGKIREAYRLYVAEDFQHHNVHFKGDRQSLMQAMEENHKENPDKVLTVKHALKEDDMVAVHSHVKMKPEDERGIAVFHLFRFEDDRVVELWDVGEAVPEEVVNENGMF